LTAIFGKPPFRISQGQSSDEAATEWYLFCFDGKHYGVVTYSQLSRDENVIKDVEAKLQTFKDRRDLAGAILLIRGWNDEEEVRGSAGTAKSDLIVVESDPVKAAERVFMKLTTQLVVADNIKWDDDTHSKAP